MVQVPGVILFAALAQQHLESLGVELIPFPDGQSSQDIRIRFMNRGKEAIKICRPMDGSESCWIMPHYRFSIRDVSGKEVQPLGRCGIFGIWEGTKWPEDYLVEIRPGGAWELEFRLGFGFPKVARYRVGFEYTFDPKHADPRYRPPEGLWAGSSKAPEVVAELGGAAWVKIVCDTDAEHLADRVTYVDASSSKLTEAGLKSIARLPRLKSLRLQHASISDEGLAELAQAKTLLKLELDSTHITNGGLKTLGRIHSLEELRLYDTAITDAGLPELASLANLKSLSIARTGVTDEGARHLAALQNLEVLFVYETQITDRGLVSLSKLFRLRHFSISPGQFSQKSLDELKASFPGIEIFD